MTQYYVLYSSGHGKVITGSPQKNWSERILGQWEGFEHLHERMLDRLNAQNTHWVAGKVSNTYTNGSWTDVNA